MRLFKNSKYKAGWGLELRYEIHLHRKDTVVLEQISKFFNGVGNIYVKSESSTYCVSSEKDLQVIINHFNNYPLQTQKRLDFWLLKQAFALKINKEHLTEEGILKLVAIKASINRGLSDEQKLAFPNITPVEKPIIIRENTVDPYWLAGFTYAEGCFF